MSEVKEHSVIYLSPSDDPEREWCQDDVWEESVRYNLGADFDRVTAERDALQARETGTRSLLRMAEDSIKHILEREAALQALLTAADEELARDGGAYLNKNAECLKLRERADVLEGLLIRWLEEPHVIHARKVILRKDTEAALKPAEEPRNQCDGCQAGIPVVNGAHRMGKPDGYPDTMSCTSKLYKPASGSTCNQILEESGLPTNYPCKSCGRGACIDR